MSAKEFLTCQRIVSIMVLCGFLIHHPLRVNISIAIVEMVQRNDTNLTQKDHGPRFSWDEEEKNNILGCFFWGYLITQIPGGRLSEKFGAKRVVGTGLLLSSVFTLLTPVASQLGYYWLILVRFLFGVSIGIHWPSTAPIATNWIEETNRATFMSHMSASSLGVALVLPIYGYLIEYLGWPSVFYSIGTLGLIWTLLWWYLIYDTPEQHPRISEEEKQYLKNNIVYVKASSTKQKTPWAKMLTSGPVWAIIMGNTLCGVTFFIAFNQLPTYMSSILHFTITQNGWFSSLPYFVRYCSSVSSAIIADKLKKSEKVSTTTLRKSVGVAMFFGTAALFTMQALWGYSNVVTIIVFSGSLGLIGLGTPGFQTNTLDIAPAYSGTIFGMSQIPAALTGYVTTKIVALLTKDRQGFEQWSYVFWMLVAINLFGGIFSFLFISGEEQEWSKPTEEVELRILNYKRVNTINFKQ